MNIRRNRMSEDEVLELLERLREVIRKDSLASMQTISAEETARLLRTHVDRVYRMARNGEIPCVRLGEKSLRFRVSALRQWMEENEKMVSAVDEAMTDET